MKEIKKPLYTDPKNFYNDLRDEGKVDVHGDILMNELSKKQIEKYNEIMANKNAICDEYSIHKNKASTEKTLLL